jgi:adenylate cyclase
MRARRVRRARLTGLLAVALVSCGLGAVAYATDLLRTLDLTTVDTRFTIRGTQGRPDDLVVVGIDDRTFQALQRRWPFPRHLHALVIDRLTEAGAKAIGYDVQFTEPTTPREDNALIDAVDRAHGVVLSTTEVNERGESNVFGGEEVVRSIGARAGNTTIQADPNGVLRHFPISYDGLASFPVAVVEAAGEAVDRGDAGGNDPWIDYRGPPGTIRYVSFSDVLRGKVPESLLRDKIVLVGATAPSLQDFHATPIGEEHEMPGVEVQANAVWTVENGFPLQSTPGWLNIALILLFGIAAPAAQLRVKPLLAFGGAVGIGLLFALFAQLAFERGWIVSVVYPLGTLSVAAVGALAVTALITAYERQWVRDTFARFVPEPVVDEVLARAEVSDLRLVGVRREGTVMFCDLRGFTSMAESLPPDTVIDVLNHYLSEMSDAIMDHGGTLVAYMGDGIMAIFGAPIEQPDHADRALAAAREMLDVRLERFNTWIRAEGLSEGFRMGIGLNSGLVMSGQVGSERRIEYTAVGDTTNTAARLEGMTKGTPHMLFVADSTRALLTDASLLQYVDELPVRGRSAPIGVWTLATDTVAA